MNKTVSCTFFQKDAKNQSATPKEAAVQTCKIAWFICPVARNLFCNVGMYLCIMLLIMYAMVSCCNYLQCCPNVHRWGVKLFPIFLVLFDRKLCNPQELQKEWKCSLNFLYFCNLLFAYSCIFLKCLVTFLPLEVRSSDVYWCEHTSNQ